MDDRCPASRDRVRTSRGWSKFLALALICAFAVPASAKLTVARKKQIALSAYDDAEKLREDFKAKPNRSRADYQRLVDAYRKVYYTAPNSTKADVSVRGVADLLAEEGRAFHDDRLLRNAIGQYQFLRKEYPGSPERVGALYAIGRIYAEDLGDAAQARQTFQEFVRRYPRSELFDDAKQALADLEDGKIAKRSKAEKNAEAPAKSKDDDIDTRPAASQKSVDSPVKKTVAKKEADSFAPAPKKTTAKTEAEAPAPGELPPAVRAAAEKADAAVDKLDAKPVKRPAEALTAGSRDKTDTTLSAASEKQDQPATTEQSRKGKLPLVTGIRHWSTPDYTRIAVDLEQEVQYEVGRVSGPDRLFFDLHGTKLAPALMPGKEYEVEDGLLKKVRVAQFLPGETRIVLDLGDVADYQAFLLPNPYRLIVDVHGKKPTAAKTAPAKTAAPAPVTVGDKKPPEATKPTVDTRTVAAAPKADSSKTNLAAKSDAASPADAANAKKTSAPKSKSDQLAATASNRRSGDDATPDKTATAKTDSKAADDGDDDSPPAKAANTSRAAERTISAHEAKPTAAGDRSLIRALGLKIGRIVVDAGHGGHDTGTIGPTGLLEKDLVLDVALRLGKLLQARMGADVVYTRDDDTFIPLETRTAIANREQADLFISVHANSSHDPKARGIETYYLNFTTSADALEVAARENAVSDTSIHELQDLVKKIALKEKVEESKEFASDVQQSLRTGLSGRGANMRDRGVKKAPFIVLIGANMPSILAEISFVSNPADEKRLKTPEYRQKIAESLYRGVARYVSGLSGVKVASNAAKGGQ